MQKRFLTTACLCALMGASMVCCSKKTTVSGAVVRASSDTVTIATAAGDTLSVSTMNTDKKAVQKVFFGDSVELTYQSAKDAVNALPVAKTLTVTAPSPVRMIAGEWVEPNPINTSEKQGFTLAADGSAMSINMATLQVSQWTLASGKLLLTAQSFGNGTTINTTDTLTIDLVSRDSLVLSQNGQVRWRLSRKVK